jgi:lipopolysaccharide biosynthesis glycosyltransferase
MRAGDWRKLKKSVEAISIEHRLVQLSPEMEQFDGLPHDWGSSVMTYARLALPELVDTSRVIYIDADLIVQRDLTSFMTLDLEGKTVAAARNPALKTLGEEQLPIEEFDLDPVASYLQAGFLVIDLDQWRERKISQRVLEYLRTHPDHSIYWDQSALNVVLYGDWLALSGRWNTVAFWADSGKQGACLDDPILHFIGPYKPWLLGHHKTPSAGRFFEILDLTYWKGWRPSKLRFFFKLLKYRMTRLFRGSRA